MNLRTIGLVIRREYLNRVKKKSFILTTLLVPILVAGLTIGVIALLMNTKDKVKSIAVLDESGIVMPYLEDTETIHYTDCSGEDLDALKAGIADTPYDGVLSIGALDPENKTVSADIFSPKPFGMELLDNIDNRINRAVEDYRIASYQIEGLDQIMKDVKSNIHLRSYTVSDSGEEKLSEAGVYSILSMILGIILFMFITVFGSMVMSAVIEEKSSRVVEVLVSSVKATDLMFGKIIGIALVALTQFLMWIILSGAIISIGGAALGADLFQKGNPTEMVESMGVNAADMEAVTAQVSSDGGINEVLSTIRNLPFGQIIALFLFFFTFGYLLYASMFAAIGSAVENEGDTQQLQLPLTVPLMLAYFIALYAFRAPDSSIAVFGSIFPFTSPIVMISRLPFGVPTVQLVLSMVLLVLTFVFMAWLSAKIYKVGILMFGKKSTWKDLWKWFKQK
ncbi:MAG: ABC transporter permease [Bacteroidales bacterium]|nr:ABC transporter permease [Bacteroidales bacterium]